MTDRLLTSDGKIFSSDFPHLSISRQRSPGVSRFGVSITLTSDFFSNFVLGLLVEDVGRGYYICKRTMFPLLILYF